MKRPSKIPARKTTKPAPKKAPKDAPQPPPTPGAKAPAPEARDRRLPAPGTTAVREYKGKDVKVKYLEGGVEVDGKHFESLSAAARHVTGAASINGFLFFNLVETDAAKPKAKKQGAAPIGNGNDLGTPEGQRAALAAVGIAKRGRPVGKTTSKANLVEPSTAAPSKPPKGTPEQAASAAKARAARAAKKAERTAR